MSLEYIRNYYCVPANRGRLVEYRGRRAVITGASGQYLRLKFTDEPKPHPGKFHPTYEINYSPKGTNSCN